MIRFDFPEMFLLAIPLLFVLKKFAWTAGVTGWLRVAFLLVLLTALAFPRLNMAGHGIDIIVVVDRSRSMPGSDQELKDLLNDLENNRGTGDRVSVVGFGAEAEVEHELSDSIVTNEFTRVIDQDGSDLNEAILTALDRRTNPERPARILVLTDGLYNGPSPLYAARRAREQSVPIDYREFSKPVLGDIAVESIILPREIAPNEPFQFSVLVFADMSRKGTVIVKRNGVPVAQRSSNLLLGMNRLIFRDWVEEPGMHEYSAEITFDATGGSSLTDPVPENDRATSVMRVRSDARLLLVTHDGESGNLGRALSAGQVPFDVVKPQDSSMTLDALDAYRAVILENVTADSIGRVRMDRLRQFVEDVGGGLMMTGGQQSFGTGGYYKSPLEDILPVALDSIEETRRTRAAIVVVLDRSGSMAAPVDGGKTKMDLANIGTAECVRMLSAEDQVSVIAVDSSPHVVQEMTKVTKPIAISQRVLSIQSMGGGIFVYQGLLAAGQQLLKARDYKTRHIILFSDAADSEEPGDYVNLLKKYGDAGITVSVIGLGADTDPDADFLIDIAKRGNGNIEFTNDPLDLPRLFTKDTMNITRNMFLTRESESRPDGFTGMFLPNMKLLGEIEAESSPPVDGYNLTFLKSDASQGLVTTDENKAPLSAFWYRGLGRVATVAFEMDGEFSGDLTGWNDYDSFVLTHARWLLGEDESEDVFISLRQEGLDAVVEVELDPNRANDKRGLTPTLAIIPPSQERSQVFSPEFMWTGPNTLQGRFRLNQQGTWRTLVKTDEREFTQGPILSLPYSPEYMPREGLPNGTESLQSIAEISGGVSRVNLLESFQDVPSNARSLRSLVPLLCLLGVLLLLTEISGRRWNWWERLAIWRNRRAAEKSNRKKPTTRGLNVTTKKRHDRMRSKPARQELVDPSPEESQVTIPETADESQAPAKTTDVFSRAKNRARNRTK